MIMAVSKDRKWVGLCGGNGDDERTGGDMGHTLKGVVFCGRRLVVHGTGGGKIPKAAM